MVKLLLIFFSFIIATADPVALFGTNDIGAVEFSVGGGGVETLRIRKIGTKDTALDENPANYSVANRFETPSFLAFLTKTEHQDRFSLPEDSNLLWSENEFVATTAFTYRQFSIADVPDSSGITIGNYGYQIVYDSIPPQPVATNVTRIVLRGAGRTNFFIGVARKLDSGGRYLGWVELVRPQADVYAPFSFGRSALDFLPDRAIKAGQQPEFPKVQSEVTESEVRLSVPAAYRRYLDTWLVMEKANSLDEPVNWEPLAFSGTNSMTLPADAEMRFYRLRLVQ